MIEAQRIACKNDATVVLGFSFVMSFSAKADGYITPETGYIKKGEQQVIDLAYYPFPEGPACLVEAGAPGAPALALAS